MNSSGEYVIHTATAGDMWDIIALKYYGDEKKSSQLISFNPLFADVVIFDGGEKIKIPKVTEAEIVSSLPPWRR